MGAWFICRSGPEADARLGIARAQFRRHGLPEPIAFDSETHTGLISGPVCGGPANFLRRGDDFIAVAGTLFHCGMTGEPALQGLLDDFRTPFDRWDDLIGQFALLVRKEGRIHVLTDYFGAFQIFHDASRDMVSTSMLSIVENMPRLSWSIQGVYEFALGVFPLGDESVFQEIKRLGPHERMELGETQRLLPCAKPRDVAQDARPASALVRDMADRLLALSAAPARLFADRIHCPLSGGYDSRLALALLRAHGVRPHVYVYGEAGDRDVEIARAIGAGEGFEVEAFHKDAWRVVTPDEFPEIVRVNFDENDGLITDSGLFDNGANGFARRKRQADGGLTVSGGCGEIFRNFFFLPDRTISPLGLLHAFYAQFDPADLTDAFDEHRYFTVLAAKLSAALQTSRQRLCRADIDWAYPAFRCRSFFGREISLVGRHGAYFMPFFEPSVVRAALGVPYAHKRWGQFEAALIAMIDPALARYPSSYGHSFAKRPAARRRLAQSLGLWRPPALRRYSYRIRKLLGEIDDDHGGLTSPGYLARVIDLGYPAMRRFFRLETIRDVGLRRRIANLEYLAVRLGGRLADG